MSVTTEHKNDESNPNENCIQHEKTTVPRSSEGINWLNRMRRFGERQAYLVAVPLEILSAIRHEKGGGRHHRHVVCALFAAELLGPNDSYRVSPW